MMMIRCEEKEEENKKKKKKKTKRRRRRKQKEGKTRGLFVQFYIYTYNSLLLWWYHS